MVSALASSWPSPPELETPRKKEESLKALKALVRDWDLLGEGGGGEREQVGVGVSTAGGEGGRREGMQGEMRKEGKTNREMCKRAIMSTHSLH